MKTRRHHNNNGRRQIKNGSTRRAAERLRREICKTMTEDQVTDGIIDNLKEGWAVIPFRGEKSHYWKIEIDRDRIKLYRSLCGMNAMTTSRQPALHPGTFQQCKKCQKAHP